MRTRTFPIHSLQPSAVCTAMTGVVSGVQGLTTRFVLTLQSGELSILKTVSKIFIRKNIYF